jgi:folate-binding Fe-S cluster repair protein YgfZ
MFIYNMSKSADEKDQSVLLEVHAKHADDILRYLTVYKLRSKIVIEPKNYQVVLSVCDNICN